MANRAVEEFAANSGDVTAAGGSNPASNTVYGPAGVPVIAVNSSTVTGWQQTKFDVQFQTQILPTDKISVELSSGNGVWYEAATDIPPVFQANAAYGILVRQINSTTVRVFFGNAGAYPTGATYGSASIDSWSGFTGHRWRVRKVSGGAAVGFPVSARNIVGDTSGTAVPAGMIGELIKSTWTTGSLTSGVHTVFSNPGITLTPGVYDITVLCRMTPAGATTVSGFLCAPSTTTTDDNTGWIFDASDMNVFSLNLGNITSPTGYSYRVSSPVWRVVVTTTTTYYPKMYATFGTSTATGGLQIVARRVA